VTLGTKSCLPCRQLEQFLETQKSVVSKYFVVMKANIEGERSLGTLVTRRFRSRVNSEDYTEYFPWIAFLNDRGEVLVTGDDGPSGVIGIPQGSREDRKWFLEILRIANPRLTDPEIASLDQAAEHFHRRIWNTSNTEH
jgi:hypothetical protein